MLNMPPEEEGIGCKELFVKAELDFYVIYIYFIGINQTELQERPSYTRFYEREKFTVQYMLLYFIPLLHYISNNVFLNVF